MEGILSAQHLSFSYQRLTYGYIQNGQVDEQQVLEGKNLRELAGKLLELPAETIEANEAEDPMEALRREVGEGTAFFVTYEEIRLEFTQVRMQIGDSLSDPNGADSAEGLLAKLTKAFEEIRRSLLGSDDDIQSRIEEMIDRAFAKGDEKLEKLGEVKDPVRKKLDNLLQDIQKLIDQAFGAPAA